MAADLRAVEDWAEVLLQKLNVTERRQLNIKIARELRANQKKRIGSQRNPDGTPYDARKHHKEATAKPLRFLYRKPNGSERLVDMRSWTAQGKLMTGFDREAGDLRSFAHSRVIRWLKPTGGAGGTGIRSKRGSIKRKAMFKKMSGPKFLKAQGDANSIAVGFVGRTARLARVHQYGLRDSPERNQPQTRYPQRELLGLTDADLELIRDRLLEHLAGSR